MSMARSAVTPAATDTPGRTSRWHCYSRPRRMTHTGWWYRLYAKEENGKIYPLTILPVSIEMSGINLPSLTKMMTRISARMEILKLLHISHVGVMKTRNTARQRYFWPRMSAQIQQMCELCPVCRETGKNRPREPMTLDKVTPISELCPMQVVGMDLFALSGKHYFMMVDKYSGFPMHKLLQGESTAHVIEAMTSFCNWMGWPEVVRVDYGPWGREGGEEGGEERRKGEKGGER